MCLHVSFDSYICKLYFRSEGSPPLAAEGYRRNADSPISEDPDYADESENGGDTELSEHNNERGNTASCSSTLQ